MKLIPLPQDKSKSAVVALGVIYVLSSETLVEIHACRYEIRLCEG